ncbi:MAG TPA: hypothetical protein VFW86_03070, partial [Candidatus Limnocylindrales bacterium]|nr:hypothetical protein [Candidatus Limnocylindrales bacterium]
VAAANRPRSTPLEATAPGRASGLVGLDGRALQAVRPPAPASLDGQVLEAAGATIRRDFDANTGGWGGAPKFPQPLAVEFLLREAAAGDDDALAVASRHLLAMAAGGIHDLVGGGFARYATDARWLVPHFEKMLYDNAQIARACLHAWQLGGNERLRELAGESLAFLLETMTNDAGAFIASLDADTDGVEGATYTWTVTEIEAALAPLGPEVWPLAAAAWGVTPEGNWEGRTILHEARDPRDLALAFGLPEDGVRSRLGAAKARLREVRRERPQPGRDDKIVAAWNGLALSALSEAAAALDRPDFAAAAVRCAAFLVDALVDEHGLLHRTWRDGRVGPVATLEDHAALAEGLLCLYELTFDERWFVEARRLMDRVRHHFADPAGGWFDTSDDGERLIVRPKAIQDNATPSGNALTSTVLLRLAGLTGDGEERRTAEAALGLVTGHVERYPTAFAAWLVALDLAVRPLTELAIVGRSEDPITAALIGVAREGFRPRMMVAAAPPVSIAGSAVPLLEGRTAREGRAAAYVCREFACRAPVSSPDALRAELALQSGSTARPSR